MLKRILAGLVAAAVCFGAAVAQERTPSAAEQAEIARLTTLRDSLKPQRGVIAIPDAKATMSLGSRYYFLGPADAKRVLTEGWGNPPDAVENVLGLILPEGKTFLDDTWGAVVTYVATDYVSDEDAKTTNYDEVLSAMRDGETEDNAARKKAGYDPIVLVGWAQSPTYDPLRHDLIWARQLRFGGETDNTLNYDVRHLGRHGVLSLNMVSRMSQIETVRTSASELAQTVEFNAGERYADYQAGDKVANFGLAGLVAAGAGVAVAKKAGLLALIIAFGKKGLALIAVGGAAAVNWVRKRFGLGTTPAAPAASERTSDGEDTLADGGAPERGEVTDGHTSDPDGHQP